MEVLNSMESLVIDACRVKTTLQHEKEKVVSDADKLGKALCAKIFSMCFGSFWTPSKNGGVSGIIQSPASEPQRVTDVHIVAAYLHRPSRNLKLHRMTKAMRERDDDEFFKKNRVLIETKMRDWQVRAVEKLRVLAEKIQEKPYQNIHHNRPSSQGMSDSDLFDDEDSDQEEPREEQPLSEFDREIQIYMNFSKEKYVEWRDRQSKPKHNVESSYYRRFWDDHKLLMPTLSKIALKVRNFIYLIIKTSLRSPDCLLHPMRLKENLAASRIRWALIL